MDTLIPVMDRYGLPVAMLGVVTLAVYKLFWPMLVRQIDEGRQQMKEQLKESNARFDHATGEFLKALDRRDDVLQKGLKEIHTLLERELSAIKKKPRRPSE